MIERKQIWVFLCLLLAVIWTGCGKTTAGDDTINQHQDIEYIEPNAGTGFSMATVAPGDLPLAHTGQFMALNQEGELVGAGSIEDQVKQVLENIRLALAEVGAGLEDLVKLNVYVTRNEVAGQVRAYFAETFTGEAKPAASFVVTDLSPPDALVAMDAVAVAPGAKGRLQREVLHSDSLYGAPERGHVAILPAGERVYLSGQVAPGDLLPATRGTMGSLHATLAYLDLSADDVVQVKAYLPDASRADEVKKVIAEYYREKPVPPTVFVEWSGGDYLWYLSTEGEDATPIEISVIASGAASTEDTSDARDSLSYVSYPGLPDYSGYSRIVIVPQADFVYTSGLYGDPSKDETGQAQDIFHKMESILQKSGSDFEHLVKGTYYVTGKKASNGLSKIRKGLYNPERSPASDKMPVRGVGKEGAVTTINMIGVVPE